MKMMCGLELLMGVKFISCPSDPHIMIGDLNEGIGDPSPDRCPVCKKDLSGFPSAYRRKHIEKCMRSKPRYVYSDRPRGRPPTKKHIRSVPKTAVCVGVFACTFIVFELILHFL